MASKEYQDFMLGRKSTPNDEHKKNVILSDDDTNNERDKNENNNMKKILKLISTFHKVLVNEILDTDDYLEEVVGSIENLRERIFQTSRMKVVVQGSLSTSYKIRKYGFRTEQGDGKIDLRVDDLELALDYDLIQHEKMMSAFRKALASMGQGIETLGRRLSELSYGFDEECHVIYIEASKELYRKQLLGEELLQSCNDSLLMDQNKMDHSSESVLFKNRDARNTARKCLKCWSRRNCDQSYLYPLRTRLDELMKMVPK